MKEGFWIHENIKRIFGTLSVKTEEKRRRRHVGWVGERAHSEVSGGGEESKKQRGELKTGRQTGGT